MPFSALSLKP